jgi:hypothetical protein
MLSICNFSNSAVLLEYKFEITRQLLGVWYELRGIDPTFNTQYTIFYSIFAVPWPECAPGITIASALINKPTLDQGISRC